MSAIFYRMKNIGGWAQFGIVLAATIAGGIISPFMLWGLSGASGDFPWGVLGGLAGGLVVIVLIAVTIFNKSWRGWTWDWVFGLRLSTKKKREALVGIYSRPRSNERLSGPKWHLSRAYYLTDRGNQFRFSNQFPGSVANGVRVEMVGSKNAFHPDDAGDWAGRSGENGSEFTVTLINLEAWEDFNFRLHWLDAHGNKHSQDFPPPSDGWL